MGQALLLRALGLAVIWGIVAEGRADSWTVGIGAVLMALAASLILLPSPLTRVSLAHLVRFAGFFVVQSLIGAVQVARLAFVPSSLRPTFIEFAVRLPAGHGRLLLTAIVTLIPGTVSVTLDAGRLRLHVLDERMPVAAQLRDIEARLANVLRVTLEAS